MRIFMSFEVGDIVRHVGRTGRGTEMLAIIVGKINFDIVTYYEIRWLSNLELGCGVEACEIVKIA